MSIDTEVKAFVVRKDVIFHFKTLKTATKEVDSYDFMRACKDHYVCKHGDKAYLIRIDGDKFGCSCEAMTFHKGNDGCKHLAAFDKRSEPQKPVSHEIALELITHGWTGEPGNLKPPGDVDEELIDDAVNASWSKDYPETTKDVPKTTNSVETTSDEDGEDNEGSDPVPPDAEKPAPQRKTTTTGTDPKLGEKLYSRTCPHCDERFDGTDLDEVKDIHRDHIKICPENPANKPELQQAATDAKTATVEKQQQAADGIKTETTETQPEREDETMKPETNEPEAKTYDHPDGTSFESAEALLDYANVLKAAQDMDATKALMQTPASTTITAQAWSDEQIEVMKKTVAEKATPAEFAYFMNVAAATGLNPFLREIYFMKTEKGQTAIITGRDGYLTIAKRDPQFQGIQSMEVCASDDFEMSFVDGMMQVTKHAVTNFQNRGEIIGAWARGRMQGQDAVTIFVTIKEYDKGGNIWNRYKSAMIRKVAESMVLKRIAGISGLVTDAEISESKDMILDAEVV